MKKNMGQADRGLRLVLGLFLLSMLIWIDTPARYFGLIGLIPLATAMISSCPLYPMLGINTTAVKSGKQE